MVMAVGGSLGDDAHYLDEMARLFRWDTAWESDRTVVRMTCGPWMVRVWFWPLGGFRGAQAYDAASGGHELGLAQVVAFLEQGSGITPPAS